ncbi:M24 family metallopeptidase [Salinicoccus roseus]|uniref:Aminopeptidase n=1 Tax=Salinicoccus roseus TaxID=45670 RepID=A0A0C2DN49_9STAP|nr:M24 family metallopeptidase [Salinicoccus roseus]KIH71403.1 aminopeptidase [Salinicoccus roseus]MDB0579459.1 M24 family metallopeptidase [Salinicoccus roseus]
MDTLTEDKFSLLDEKMEAGGFDAFIIYGRGVVTQYGYLYYFANYYPVLRPGFVVKVRGEAPIVFYTTRADRYLAKQKGTIEDVRFTGIGDVVDSKNGILGEITSYINEHGATRTGVCGLETLMTHSESKFLKDNIGGEVVDGTNVIQKMKALKWDEEQEAVRETFRIAEESHAAFEANIAPGKPFAEVAAEVDKVARANGCISTLIFLEDGPYFLRKPTLDTIGESGLVTAFTEIVGPNGTWVEKGSLFAVGELSDEEKAVGEACVAAMEAVRDAMKPGMKVSELATIIREQSEHLDVNPGIWHGHGVGIDHDIPIIREDSEAVIEPGMVLSVHPNISNVDETVGASIADVFLIHDDHAESLSGGNYDITYL